jgi:hypothetical protein
MAKTGTDAKTDIANIDRCPRTETDVLQSSIFTMPPFSLLESRAASPSRASPANVRLSLNVSTSRVVTRMTARRSGWYLGLEKHLLRRLVSPFSRWGL